MYVQRVFNRGVFAGFLGAFLTLLAVTPAAAIAQTVVLHGHLSAWARPEADAGLAPADLTLQHLTVLLTRTPAQQQALEQLLQAQQTPGSPQYHHWLTPQQVGQRFGASQQNITAVTGWLQSQGLHVDAISNSRMRITFSGNTGAVAKALSTEFHYYNVQEQVQGQMQSLRRLAINADPQIPATLAGAISGFTGLSQSRLHPMVHSRVLPMSASPQLSNCSGTTISTCSFYLTPADFITIYDLSPLVVADITGSGEKIAIVARSQVESTDITEYEQLVKLGTYLPNVIIPTDGSDPGITNTGDQDEATLDVDRSFGTAPGSTIDLVASASSQTEDGVDIASNYAIDTVVDPILTISFGDCESDAGQAAVQAWDTLAQQGAAEGISIFVSSGDAGAFGCEPDGTTPPTTQSSASPNYLCSTSYVTCLGGTEFNDTANPGQYWSINNTTSLGSALSYIPEGAWNEPIGPLALYQLGASGGGVSAYISKPSWQTGTGVPNDGFRDTPDVSFAAADHDGYFGCLAYSGGDCSQGYFVAFAGTSAAAPSMAGVQALADQKLGGPQGNINARIYAMAASTPNAFHDATVATSGVTNCSAATPSMCNNSTPGPDSLSGGLAGYTLNTGYDQVTGWGSLDVANFVNALSGTSTKFSAAIDLTASTTLMVPSQSVNFTVTANGSGSAQPTGTVQFLSNGSNLGSPVTLVGGSAAMPSVSFPVGAYNITAQYSGDSNYPAGTSNAVVVTVVAKFTSSVTLKNEISSAFSGYMTPGTYNEYFAAFVSGPSGSGLTPTGTVQFFSNGVALATPDILYNGNDISPSFTFNVPGNYQITAQYSGDSNFLPATSNAYDLTVTGTVVPTVSVTWNSAAMTNTQPGTFTVSVTGSGATPTGLVQLYLGGDSYSPPIALSNGVGTWTATNPLPSGTYQIVAQYSGDATYSPAYSQMYQLPVVVVTTSFTLSSSPLTISAPGATTGNTATITVAGQNGFSGTISLSCQVSYTGTGTANDLPVCSLSNNGSAVLTSNTSSTTVSASFTTVAPSVRTHPIAFWSHGAGLAVAAFLLLPFGAWRKSPLRRCRKATALWGLLAFVVLGITLAGCGGSSGGGGGGGSKLGTSTGQYVVTITGTSGTLNAATTFTLTVQ